MGVVLHELEQVARLALQLPADGVHGAHAHGLGLAGFQNGQVGGRHAHPVRQLKGSHFPLCQHHIQIHNNRHTPPHTVRSFSSRISTAAAMTFFTTLTASARNAMIMVMKIRGG